MVNAEIAVLADSLAANPLVYLPEQYARSVRHQFEKQGMETETGITNRSFGINVRASDVEDQRGWTRPLSRHLYDYTTFLKGYILSLDVSAETPEKIEQLVAKAVQFKFKSK